MAEKQSSSSIVRRLSTGPITLLIITLVIFAGTVSIGIGNQLAYEARVTLSMNVQRFVRGSGTLTDEVRAYAATGDTAHSDAYWYEIRTARNREIGLENMRATGITGDEERLISEMASISNNLVPIEERSMELSKAGDHAGAIDLVYGPDYTSAINRITDLGSRLVSSIDERSAARVRFFNTLLPIFGSITTLLIISLMVCQLKNMHFVHASLVEPMMKIRDEMQNIAEGHIMQSFEMAEDDSEVGRIVKAIKSTKRNLRKYVGGISDTLSKMASGDLTARIDIDYIGDFEPIKRSLEGILDSLNDMIGRMSSSVDDTAKAITVRAERLMRGANELADISNEQAQTVEHIAGSISTLAGEMHGIADTAEKSNASTSAAATELAESNERMHEMQGAMDEINAASEGIKKISDTIAGIGSRTTIVALNAAIEAAKAGEVGRGFSVVAGEVRNLAIMCGDASRDTNALVETTLKAVTRGVELMNHMTEAMSGLIEASRESSEDIAEISTLSKEQAASLHEVSDGFEDITASVRQNAETADVSAAAAEELNVQAAHLTEIRALFDAFRLRRQ